MIKKILIYLLFSIVIFITGFFTNQFLFPKKNSFQKINFTRSSQKSQLTNPLLDCEVFDPSLNPKTNLIKKNVEEIISSSQVNKVSVYYRDLNNGPSFGINENATFSPVSLLKIPVMIAYLKVAEPDPRILQQTLPYTGNHVLKENITQETQLTQGIVYSLDELIKRMVSLSDNISFEILVNHIKPDDLKTVHQELGLVYPEKNTPDDFITVKNYASLFRILYNSTYLNREMSEKALEYLLNSDFTHGIKAGLPKGIKTTLKFGIKDDNESIEEKQIHDCGIIYHPTNPYLLCVMTKGNNRDKLIEVIKNISKTIFTNLEKK